MMGADPRESLLVRFVPPRGAGAAVTIEPPGDLRYGKAWPGGAKTLSCTVALPPGVAVPAAFDRLAAVAVVDRRTGAVAWAGRLTDPGLSVTPDGTQCSITAEGYQIDSDGWREVYGLLDRSKDSWQQVGDFSSGGGIGGDLAPGDIDMGGVDLGDIGFDGELAPDFGGIDFAGDLGDFGNIDFAGVDYPPVAGYPGYLGYLQDPLGNFGDQLPIPLGGPGDWWAAWTPGNTPSGGGTSTVSSWGRATSGTASGARTTRMLTSAADSAMITDGTVLYEGAPTFAFVPDTGTPQAPSIEATSRFVDSAGRILIPTLADSTLVDTGMLVEITTSAVTVYLMDGGTPTSVATGSVSLSVGTTYYVYVGIGQLDVCAVYVDTVYPATGGSPVVIYDAAGDATNFSTYIIPWGEDGHNRYWGLGAGGDGSARSVEFFEWAAPRHPIAPD